MIYDLIERVAQGTVMAPFLGFAVGVLLGLSPASLPSVPVVISALSPGRLGPSGERRSPSVLRAAPSVLAFVVGMDGVLGLLGYVFVQVTVAFTRASIVLHLVAAGLLGVLGLRLLLRQTSLCDRARTLPPTPSKAFMFGIFFAVGGCPACGPVAIGVGAASALVAGPLWALVILAAFVLGRGVVLLASAAVGARLLPAGTDEVPWRRLDTVVGVLFLVAAGYYLYRVFSGDVSTRVPGEPGGGLP
ncbi:MAG: cytochrome c biogenesis CcdA family protein [Actinomycetota bacterium]